MKSHLVEMPLQIPIIIIITLSIRSGVRLIEVFNNRNQPNTIHLLGVRFHVYFHVIYDVNKSGKFGHSSQPRTTLVRSFQLRQLPVTTDINV